MKYQAKTERIKTKTGKKSKEYLVKDASTGEFAKTKLALDEQIHLDLFKNIQFIYELDLANLELESFGLDVKIGKGLRRFSAGLNSYRPDEIIENIKRRTAYFSTINKIATDYYYIQNANQTRSVNQYLTHWFYPYKGKYHPQMIRALLNVIGAKEGDTILDPFIGSGTTALECQLLNINCIGIDVSPLCVNLSKAKTQSLEVLNQIKELKNEVSSKHNQKGDDLFSNKNYGETRNEKVKNFYLIAEMIAHSDSSRRGKDFEVSFRVNIDRMIKSLENYKKVRERLNLTLGKIEIKEGDARNLKLQDKSIDGIICSPPYSIALNYVQNDAHALSALGYDLNRIKDDFIGVRGNGFNKFELYNQDMSQSIKEMYRVLKTGKYCVIVIGNVTYQEQEVNTTGTIIDYCEQVGFQLVNKIDKIIFGLYNVMQKEYILIFRKEK